LIESKVGYNRRARSTQTLDAFPYESLRRHPIVSGIALGIIIACAGSYLGQAFAIHHTNEIAQQVRAEHPNDPLDGLWIIGLGITLVGSVVAMVIGIIAGLILYMELKRSAALHLRTSVRREPRKLYQ
jgi:H+/Cl- antiporter ClcA